MPKLDDVTGYKFLLMVDPPMLCTAEFKQDQYQDGTFECSHEEEMQRKDVNSCAKGVAEVKNTNLKGILCW